MDIVTYTRTITSREVIFYRSATSFSRMSRFLTVGAFDFVSQRCAVSTQPHNVTHSVTFSVVLCGWPFRVRNYLTLYGRECGYFWQVCREGIKQEGGVGQRRQGCQNPKSNLGSQSGITKIFENLHQCIGVAFQILSKWDSTYIVKDNGQLPLVRKELELSDRIRIVAVFLRLALKSISLYFFLQPCVVRRTLSFQRLTV